MKWFVMQFWQLPQQLLGGFIYLIKKWQGGKTYRFEGSFLVIKDEEGTYKTGMALGTFIIAGNISAHDQDPILLHEFGHVLQSRKYGWFYLPVIGLPSLISCMLTCKTILQHSISGIPVTAHQLRWFEKEASRMAKDYFSSRGIQWDEDANPSK